MKSIEELA